MDSFEDELLALLPRLEAYDDLATRLKAAYGDEFPQAVASLIRNSPDDEEGEIRTTFSDVCTQVFWDGEHSILSIEYTEAGSMVWMAEYAGIYGIFGYDLAEEGPFATLDEALGSFGWPLTPDADFSPGVLTPEQLKEFIRQAASPGDQFRVDSELHEFDGENIRNIEDDSLADEESTDE